MLKTKKTIAFLYHLCFKLTVIEDLKNKYIKDFDNKLKKFRLDIDTKNVSEIRMFSHKIHGSGASYGFKQISIFGMEINKLAHQEKWDEIEKKFTELSEYIDIVQKTRGLI